MWHDLALLSATQPLSQPVPGESPAAYLDGVGDFTAARRVVLRRWTLRWSGQHRLKMDFFPPGAKRVLWIYFGENQIGDALMDLASRSLLTELGLQVDLLAAPNVAKLFEADPWFGRVGSDAAGFAAVDYDCAIVLSNKHRPLRQKTRHFAGLPWVSLHEFFTGPNFHRGLFAARRLADLTRAPVQAADVEHHSRQKLAPLATPRTAAQSSAPTVAIVIGGVHRDRTYPHWHQVVRELVAAGQRRFALVGGENGKAEAAAFAQELSAQADIGNYVGRLSLGETRAVLDSAAVTAAPDGGLMHLALTTRTALVPLFSGPIAPEWRLPAANLPAALRSTTAHVGDIPGAQVVAAILRSLPAPQP